MSLMARQYEDIGASSVSSAHTADAGRPTMTSTTTRREASSRKVSSVAAMSKATSGSYGCGDPGRYADSVVYQAFFDSVFASMDPEKAHERALAAIRVAGPFLNLG